MIRFPFHLKIVESDSQLVKLLLQEIVKEFNKHIPRRMSAIDQKMRIATFNFLRNTHTYSSLLGGSLAAQFGLPSAGRQQRIDNIVQAIANRMEIEYVPVTLQGQAFNHGIRFKVLLTDFSEVLSLSEASIVTEKGQTLDWLKWLLEFGDTIIIKEYEFKVQPGSGRSGGGIMIDDNASSWRVPPIFSGTIRNNWLTRALNDNSTAYFTIIENILRQELQGI